MLQLLLGVYAVACIVALVLIWRAPHRALWILLIFLPLHTLAMTLAFHDLHPSKLVLSLFQGWKDIVVVAALIRLAALKESWRGQHLHPMDLAVLLLLLLALGSIPFHSNLGLASQLLALRNDFIFIPLYAIGRLTSFKQATQDRTTLIASVVLLIVTFLGVLERFADPIPLLLAIGLPNYLGFNFNLHFLTYGGIPYSYFQSNFARRVGSVFLDPVQLAESSSIAIGAAAALFLSIDRQRRRLGAVVLASGILAAILANGRFELLITPVLLVAAAVVVQRLRPFIGAAAFLGILYGVFSLTFYSSPYRPSGPAPAVTAGVGLSTIILLAARSTGSPDGVEPSTASHLEGIKVALSDMIHQPLGQGLGTAGLSGARSHAAGIAEGQLLVIVHSLGDPGLILLVGILAGGLLLLFRAAKDVTNSKRPGAVVGLIVLIMVSLSFPIAEIMTNSLLMATGFFFLGQVVRDDPAGPPKGAAATRPTASSSRTRQIPTVDTTDK
jgi:hypothetical protein